VRNQVIYSGVDIWPIIRGQIYRAIFERSMGFAKSHTSTIDLRARDKVAIFAKNFFNLFVPGYHSAKQFNFGFISTASLRRKKVQGKYFDIIADYYADVLNGEIIIMEWPVLGRHYTPVYSANIMYLDFLVSRLNLARAHFLLTLPKVFKDFAHYIFEVITRHFGRILSLDDVHSLMLSLGPVPVLKDHIEKLILRLAPKILFIENGSDSGINRVINKVCRELGVITVDVQHGVIYEMHPSYSYPEWLFEYYKQYLPDYVFTWGEYWNRKARGHLPSTTLAVGNPHLEWELSRRKSNLGRTSHNGIVLFISQGTIGNELSDIALELSAKLPSGWCIYYKLHPGEVYEADKRYASLYGRSSVQVIDDPTVNIYDLFIKSQCVVGVYSTALFEAIMFGFKPLVLRTEISESIIGDLEETGAIDFFTSSDELLEKLMYDNTILYDDNLASMICSGPFEENLKIALKKVLELQP